MSQDQQDEAKEFFIGMGILTGVLLIGWLIWQLPFVAEYVKTVVK